MSDTYKHCSVLLTEAIEQLNIRPQGCYVDATYGRGGHSRALLKHLQCPGQLLAIDKDTAAAADAQQLRRDNKNFNFYQGSFAQLQHFVAAQGLLGQVDGLLFDLGVSSPQFDEASRGFSFQHNGPLDMRMDTTTGITAAEWLATASAAEISKVIFDYGEERFARKIANKIVHYRQQQAITHTQQLAELVKQAYPAVKAKTSKIHPATLTFQAIRIHINQELTDLHLALAASLEVLAPGGRLVVISFHSLEDRIVKRFMRDEERGPFVPKNIPLTGNQQQGKLRRIGKLIVPSSAEVASNPRARSAKCRVAERRQ